MNTWTKLIEESKLEIKDIMYANKQIGQFNFNKVLDAFVNHGVTDTDLNGTSGYGYDDLGRDKLEAIYAEVFKGEDAIVRTQIVSGTHAISLVLLTLLESGDELLYITGEPYDTLEKVIGDSENDFGTLKYNGVNMNVVPLKDNTFDSEAILNSINENTKMIAIQRSRGYSSRKSVMIEEIRAVIAEIKKVYPEIIIFVDNCYGEFVEKEEPLEAGADIIAGSLIKNPGGGLAKMGGYIVGHRDLVDKVSYRLTVPGIGKEMGASLGELHAMYQGFFLAPHVVIEALNGAVLTSHVLEKVNVTSDPKFNEPRTDLIQSIMFNSSEEMIGFAQSIQKASPVNSLFAPIPDSIPGYTSPVIMAAGTFVQGGSLELSADGPIRAPYRLYLQGGLTFEHVVYALEKALEQHLKS